MANTQGLVNSKTLLGALWLVVAGLGAWNLKETHNNATTLSAVNQIVVDSVIARNNADQANEKAHDRIEAHVKTLVNRPEWEAKWDSMETRMEALSVQMDDVKRRLTILESKPKI